MAATAAPARLTPTELPPGPRLPGAAQTLRYTFAQPAFFARQRERFGPTWSLRLPGFPPAVVTADRSAIKALLTGDPLGKRHANDLLAPVLGPRSLMLLEPLEHVQRRKLELPPFHGDRIRVYAERIRELMGAEVDSWRSGEVVAVHPRARQLTLAVILELVLGVRDEALRRRLADIFDSLDSPLSNLGLFLPEWFTRRRRWNLLAEAVAWRKVDRLDELLHEHIAQVRRDPAIAERTDVLSMLVHDTDLDDAELRDELVTLVAAGHETTATAIAWAADLLAHHPEVAARLREGKRDDVQATAKEVLRARTVAYISAGRHSLEPLPIGHWVVGPEVAILVDAQGLHGDPELWDEPSAFRPERFLDNPPDAYGYLPFGGGAHRCLGAALATMELELAIEAMATRVTLEPAAPPARPVRRGVTLAPKGGARVKIA
jgi:cytochrome P450